ncbi:MAG: cupin domain-containing protein [Pseudomonadota bacterium]
MTTPALLSLLLLSSAAQQSANEADALPEAFEAGWQGRDTCEQLFENEEIRVGRCTFPPGIGHERHWHPSHWGYILSGGTMRITDADGTAERSFETGGSWWSDGVAWHEAVNIGDTTAIYLIIEPKDD